MSYSLAAESSGQVFSHTHIAVSAAITGLLALAGAWWRLPHRAWTDVAAIAVLSAASVYLWRASANMPQLNGDGLPGFSANDWLAPASTYLFLGLYAQARPQPTPAATGRPALWPPSPPSPSMSSPSDLPGWPPRPGMQTRMTAAIRHDRRPGRLRPARIPSAVQQGARS